MEFNMDKLQELYNTVVDDDTFTHMGVLMKVPDAPAPEMIINPRANFESKMAYYVEKYDYDGYMKVNPNVQILSAVFCTSAEQAARYFQSLS